MSENENDFEALRRLLALKRHEIPPPGYFEDFSGGVIARIRAAQSVQQLPWLLRFLQAFESRPAYPVALASSLCMLLLFGIVTLEQQPEVTQVFPTAQNANGSYSTEALRTDGDSQTTLALANTNPPVNLSGNGNAQLFNAQPSPLFQQAGFTPAN
jgi:hypothetical protein